MSFALSHLLDMARLAAIGKRSSPEVATFMLDPVPKLAALQRELEDRTYMPGSARPFLIHEP